MNSPRKRPRLSTAGGNEPDIEAMRQEHDRRFLGRLDGILQKYDRDFEGISDEIDMNTGQIVVNNGHVQGARNAYDIGPPVRRGAAHVLATPEIQSRLARRQSTSSALAREIHNVVHHHYAPELHQNIGQAQRQPDLASSMLQILTRIERMEARNERLHLKLMDRLGPMLECSPRHHLPPLSGLDPTSPSPSWHGRHSVSRDRSVQVSQASHRQLPRHYDLQPSISTPMDDANDKRRQWTPTEEQKVVSMRAAGCSFTQIARDMPSRSLASIKLHWYNYLHPDIAEAEVDPYTGSRLTPRRGDVWAPSHPSSPELSPESENGDYEELVDHSPRRQAHLPVPHLRLAHDEDQIRNHDLEPAESDHYGRWKQEEDDYLLDLVKQELKSKSGKSKWNRIIAKFIQRFPNRRTASIKPRFTRIVPGGIGAVSEFLRQNQLNENSILDLSRLARPEASAPRHALSQGNNIEISVQSKETDHTHPQKSSDEQIRQGDDSGSTPLRKRRVRSKQNRPSREARVHPAGHAMTESREFTGVLEDRAVEESASGQLITKSPSKPGQLSLTYTKEDESRLGGSATQQQDIYDVEEWRELQRQKRVSNLSLDHERKWTKDEIQRLENLCAGIPRGQRIRGLIEGHFPDRSFRSIQTKLQKLRKAGVIPVDPESADQPGSSESDVSETEPQLVSPKVREADLTEAPERQDDTSLPRVAQMEHIDPVAASRVSEQCHLPARTPRPRAQIPQPMSAEQPKIAIVVDSDQSEPPSTLGSMPHDDVNVSESSELISNTGPPPRKRGRPSKADKAAREAWYAAQQTLTPTALLADPTKITAASFASKPVEPSHASESEDTEKSEDRKPVPKKPKRKSEPVFRSLAADKARNETTPISRTKKKEHLPSDMAASATVTPKMPSRPKSTPTAFSAPPLQRSRVVPVVDDLSEDELA